MASPLTAAAGTATETLVGVIERVTYRSDENGWTVARLSTSSSTEPVTVVGTLLGADQGATLKLWGRWVKHPRYGRQFKVETFSEEVPATRLGVERYLASGKFKGIGPAIARRIVDHFGDDALAVLDQSPDRLVEVDGIGARKAAAITDGWSRQHAARDLMVYLQGHGVSAGLAGRIHAAYGDQAKAVVQREPYVMARDIHGVGFRTADRIALSLGMAADSPARVDAGVVFALQSLADEGHTTPPADEAAATAARLLGVEADSTTAAVERLKSRGEIAAAPKGIGLPRLVTAEEGIARGLADLLRADAGDMAALDDEAWGTLFDRLAGRVPHTLSPDQRRAVQTAFTARVAVLTGGPGTGKTTTVRAILQLARSVEAKVALAAPTGRAAKRLEEATGHRASTLHRLLEFSPHAGADFKRGPERPVAAHMVVVDEASMVDVQLMQALARALAPGTHLLMVGDADQLPSVGAGNVLHDLMASATVPVARLETIHRQAADSLIVANAHRVNRGSAPRFPRGADDFFLFRVHDGEAARDLLVDVVSRRIPRRFGLNPARDVQVLAPMHRGPCGVAELNRALQERLNPARPGQPEVRLRGHALRVGDRVMQTRNDYGRDVFNGDQGRVQAVDASTGAVKVDFDGHVAEYPVADSDALTLAYACSVHKSQGSEFPCVVLALLPAHYVMLQRNLLYTAVTRARRLCVIVGSEKALHMAVANDRVAERHTSLVPLLHAATGVARTVTDMPLNGSPQESS